MARLEGKKALVTGGARGLGRATVRLLVEEGAQVIITDVLADEGRAVASEIGAVFLTHDVADEQAWRTVKSEALEQMGRIDILMNNAGILHRSTILDHNSADWDKVISVNQRSVFLGMREIGAVMTNQGNGSIVNVSSVAFHHASPATAAYTATKFAIVGMTRVAAKEMGPHGVRINAILPGLMDSQMIEEIDPDRSAREQLIKTTPLRRTAAPEEVAKTVLFLASDESSFVTGESILVDGGSGC